MMEKEPYIICITEQKEIAQEMKQKGFPVIALLNDSNRNDLTFIPYAIEDLSVLTDDYLSMVWHHTKGIPRKIAETNRLMIRELAKQDAAGMEHLCEDPSVSSFFPEYYENRSDLEEYLDQYCKRMYDFLGYGYWGIICKETEELIGIVGFHGGELEDGVEIGYAIRSDYQRNGYAYEACREVLAYAKKMIDIQKVYAKIDETNEASERLCLKLGFKCISRLREGKYLLVYA